MAFKSDLRAEHDSKALQHLKTLLIALRQEKTQKNCRIFFEINPYKIEVINMTKLRTIKKPL